jgi:hypothetical protein
MNGFFNFGLKENSPVVFFTLHFSSNGFTPSRYITREGTVCTVSAVVHPWAPASANKLVLYNAVPFLIIPSYKMVPVPIVAFVIVSN